MHLLTGHQYATYKYMDREQIIAVSKSHLKLLDTAVMNGEIKS